MDKKYLTVLGKSMKQTLFRLYEKLFKKAYGACSGEDQIQDLVKSINAYNAEIGELCVKMETVGENIAIALCTPLMKRVHRRHNHSAELAFIDSSGGMDKFDCRIFMILTHGCAGGMPLGCLVTTSESRQCITLALSLLLDVIPEDAFFGRGKRGPVVILTDDSDAERASLREIFPETFLVLCVFHLLQALWRYLWDGKNAIPKEDRPHLLSLVKVLVYATSEDELETAYVQLQKDNVAVKYSKYISYCDRLYKRKEEWALCFRQFLPLRGNNTNNYAEAAMRILKDKIFERVRAYNVVQLLDFLLSRLPSYYERRLIDLANGRTDMALSRKYLPYESVIPRSMVSQVEPHLFKCQSQTKPNTEYFVDTSIATCTCYVGLNGAPCKHQYAVAKHFGLETTNFLMRDDPKKRQHFWYLATGIEEARLVGLLLQIQLPCQTNRTMKPLTSNCRIVHWIVE